MSTGLRRILIIAEAGSNWYAGPGESEQEQLRRASGLVMAAAIAGADAVKFQAFTADALYLRSDRHWDMVRPLELPLSWLPLLARYAQDASIEFMCSAFSEEMVDAVDPFVKRHKVASLEVTDLSLLRHIASKGRPVIMSTGAADRTQVLRAVQTLSGVPIAVLHCTTAYPCPPEEAGLGSMRRITTAGAIPGGLSDHTLDPIVAPVIAVALGATIIEKHFTLDRHLSGPDHHYSLEPFELKQMVSAVRLAEKMLGGGIKRIQPSEEAWRPYQHRDGGVRGV